MIQILNGTSKMKIFLITIGVLVLLLIGGLVGGYIYVQSIIAGPQGEGETQTFLITRGEGVKEIADALTEAKLIKSSEIFQFYLWQQGLTAKIQTGSYEIDPKNSMKVIAEKIVGGGVNPDEQRVTIIEGLRRDEVAKLLVENGLGTETEFLQLTANPKLFDYVFLKGLPSGATLEGFLYPDTYIFSKKNTTKQMVTKMLDNFDVKTKAMRAEATAKNKNFFEVLSLASIVQAEVPHAPDQATVAGIFYNRLEIGMKLQSNVTVNFVLKNRVSALSLIDIAVDSPYNTYKYPGITPGPINSPGSSAITATLNPTASDYLFFLTKLDGTPVYSKTGAEHNAAKKEFLD